MSPNQRPLSIRFHLLLRWLHVYTSMISLLVVLFFALTGITLNHPDWVFGSSETRQEVKGTLPQGWLQDGKVDWLKVSDYFRSQHGIHGTAKDYRNDDTEGDITFNAPGYQADAQIDMKTGQYSINVAAQGAVAVLNDLHRGRDSGKAWGWVIDLSGAFLALVALTGLGIMFYLKKLRAKAFAVAGIMTLLVIALMKLAT